MRPPLSPALAAFRAARLAAGRASRADSLAPRGPLDSAALCVVAFGVVARALPLPRPGVVGPAAPARARVRRFPRWAGDASCL
jgi:hypothetical protein